jgi:ABC-type branched-subunit amino acid transport system substrate-binding protein
MVLPEPQSREPGLARREFLRHAAALAGSALLLGPGHLLAASHGRGGEDVLRVGFLASARAAGQAAVRGLELGVEEAVQALGLLGRGGFEAVAAEADDPGATARETERLIVEHRVFALIGGFDRATAAVLGRLAAQRGVLFLNVGCADDALRGAACHRTTFHVAASEAMGRDALAMWRQDSADAATDDGAVAELWHPELERFGAGQLNERFHSRFGEPLQPLGWASWMAVKVLWESAARARTTDAETLIRHLESSRARFDGHKGMPLSFRAGDHQLRQPLYIVRRAADAPAGKVAELLDEVPRARRGEDRGWTELLDQLGAPGAGGSCAVLSG